MFKPPHCTPNRLNQQSAQNFLVHFETSLDIWSRKEVPGNLIWCVGRYLATDRVPPSCRYIYLGRIRSSFRFWEGSKTFQNWFSFFCFLSPFSALLFSFSFFPFSHVCFYFCIHLSLFKFSEMVTIL